MAPIAQADLRHGGISMSDFTQIFHSGKFADATISCDNDKRKREFRVHRAIVCPQSEFLSAAFGGNFQEAKEQRLHLANEDPDTVERVLSYLYSGDYDDGRPSISTAMKEIITIEGIGSNPFLNNANVYLIAEKFGMQKLKLLAKEKYTSVFASTKAFDSLSDSIPTVYEWTAPSDRPLRDAVCGICARYRSDFMARPEFREICAEYGDFAVEFMKEAFRLDDEKIDLLLQSNGVDSLEGLGMKLAALPTASKGIAYDEDIDVYGD